MVLTFALKPLSVKLLLARRVSFYLFIFLLFFFIYFYFWILQFKLWHQLLRFYIFLRTK